MVAIQQALRRNETLIEKLQGGCWGWQQQELGNGPNSLDCQMEVGRPLLAPHSPQMFFFFSFSFCTFRPSASLEKWGREEHRRRTGKSEGRRDGNEDTDRQEARRARMGPTDTRHEGRYGTERREPRRAHEQTRQTEERNERKEGDEVNFWNFVSPGLPGNGGAFVTALVECRTRRRNGIL
jgi:hypothetical protein